MSKTEDTPTCPICGKNGNFLFEVPCDHARPKNSNPYKIYWCAPCNFGFLFPRPSKDEISEFYKIEYYTHTAEATDNTATQSFFDRARIHAAWRIDNEDRRDNDEYFRSLRRSGASILEIGCGNGSNLLRFQAEGFEVTGVEPDKEALSTSQRQGLTVYDGTAEFLPQEITKNKYDVVLISHVLEHCLDIRAAVLNARAILKQGGYLVIEVPNHQSLGFKEQMGGWPFSDIPRHLNYFTGDSLKKLLMDNNCEILETRHSGFIHQFSNSWLAHEKKVWNVLHKASDTPEKEPHYKIRAWKLILRSMFASRPEKYYSVRVIARPKEIQSAND